jgi:hypothetical protein
MHLQKLAEVWNFGRVKASRKRSSNCAQHCDNALSVTATQILKESKTMTAPDDSM